MSPALSVSLALAAVPSAVADAPHVPVVVIVRVAKPWFAFDFLVTGKMRESIPQYAALQGLVHKAYAFQRPSGDFGGLYLWSDRASAEKWFTPSWFARVRRERGVEGDVRTFEAPVVHVSPGASTTPTEGSFVAALVWHRSPAPSLHLALAPLVEEPGLQRAYALRRDDGATGVLSLWNSRAQAEQGLAASERATAEWFDVPIELPVKPENEALPSAVHWSPMAGPELK